MMMYSQLGKNGQLGNQMFQYAALYGAAFIRGYDACIPEDGHRLSEVFKIPHAKKLKSFPAGQRQLYQEPGFEFNANLWCLPKGVDLHGYFQSDLYFAHCSDRIREEFEFNDSVVKKAEEYMASRGLVFDKPIVSIHVRRGDYLNLSHYHTNLGIPHYRKIAYDLTSSVTDIDFSFYVFSDDIEWCKENLGIDNCEYIDSGYDAADLYIMSRCAAHIIANSSFSWWGAWLSKCDPRNVFAPANWFAEKGPQNWETVYPQGWTKIG